MKIKVALILNACLPSEGMDDGGYTVYAPSLKGCISEGNTKVEALNKIKEAIELYLEEVEDDAFLEEAIMEEISV